MKILYDYQIFSLQNYGGISRYFCELMCQFSKNPGMDFTLALRDSSNENLCSRPTLYPHWSNRRRFFSCNRLFPAFQKLFHINLNKWFTDNQSETIRSLKKQDFDILHPTYYNPYFQEHLRGKPYVLTIYDMIHERCPDKFPADDPTAQWKRQLIEQAGAIIAISESTKKDILTFTDVGPDRISVIYLASPIHVKEFPRENSLYNVWHNKKPYLLFVGARGGYKNFIFFINAIAEFLRCNKNLEVCCAGGGPFSAYEQNIMTDLEISSKVYQVDANERILPVVYANARAFIFPSLYEGFGLPTLEAFSCRCPVIASNTSSLVEIGGDAAQYFDPKDPDSLVRALESVIHDNELRETCIRKGLIRADQFSWKKTARQTREVYTKLLMS